MSVEVGLNNVSFEGFVKSIDKSLIPQVIIVTVENPEVKATFDVHKTLKNFDLNSKVRITISKGKPAYKEGVDLVMRGYVISKKVGEGVYKVLYSLWGFLLIIESRSDSIYKVFDYMDEVYFKVEVI
ncbi:MAG: DNA-directed RNA polymerase subunit G [Sulfolobales archaeon]|nr:DNA-directed RNA polymerase subunit G [Sulfolobales archaeon]MCX8185706.1 DNA-directed RNA polymerase subunit G [Sulfolobales archaeon]MDW7969649.1 DNA-directed RNA polymerase subunit G [Sulfolobales archaeon]